MREQLARPGAFVVAAELVTSRGLLTAESGRKVLETARELAEDPRVDVLSITDNPGGHAMLAPDTLGTDLVARGQFWGVHTIESFHTYGTPSVDEDDAVL